GQAGSALIRAAEQVGIQTVSEVFADRTYQDNGLLTPRSGQHALVENPEQAAEQALYMVLNQQVITLSGNKIPVKAETICLHGDHQNAVDTGALIHHLLKQHGLILAAPAKR